MKVILADVDADVVDAWEIACKGLSDITISPGSIFDVRCDALVSPANSFGFMNGGIDALICERFGWDLEQRVQDLIRSRHQGELLVGQALLVSTNDSAVPFVISAPTMRVPMVVKRTANAYLAARAVILLIQQGTFGNGIAIREKVKTVAFPGLGTGIGEMAPENCARQMRAAFDDYLEGQTRFPESLTQAAQRHFVDFLGIH